MTEHSALNMLLGPGGIRPVYQPMYRLTGDTLTLYGVECLSRGPSGSNFESADVLFDYVRYKRQESLVDRACVAIGLQGARVLPSDIFLSVNVHASTLGRDHGFVPFLRAAAEEAEVDARRLTVEIVEHAPPWDGVSFLGAVSDLRSLGIGIALDDVGLGQSNFKMILDVCPDYLKVDRYFVHQCARDPKRQAVIRAVQQLGIHFGAELVAEGVEQRADVEMLCSLGITLLQGHYFAEAMTAEEMRTALSGMRNYRHTAEA